MINNLSWDFFFYKGEKNSIPLDQENKYDVNELIFQPTKSLLYFRQYGAGVSEALSTPNSFSTQVLLKYNIVKSMAFRNTFSNIGGSYPDRRVSTSQNAISVKQNNQGEMDLQVLYLNFFDFQKINKVQVLN